MIAKIKDRTQRQAVLKNRKRLKGSGISIAEDMTRDNLKLMQDAEASEVFQSVWFSNGKVRAIRKGDIKKNIVILNLFDNFENYRVS